ncbi:thiamine-phosphate diphosphorylase [Ammoniphilus oxalaticus]|uniref:Thiamine-phosphate synthase n=1 Tax=Ammoniphilus oxalaticus TaxID=66863 RepID=A0A419SK21_9BACL|nr:thiamine phosphate synthase [Ammoniphilus oxalaticus]RKD24327.1 thiamine-phosphate diphosphorylase [Ammoniphilus oxalaticus]
MINWNVYLVMDLKGHRERSAYEIAAEAIAGGAEVVQIREKELSRPQFIELARPIRQLCKEQGVTFIVNDYLDLAIELDADGLHVGQDDLAGNEARKSLGNDKLIGISASSIKEAEIALANGADYLGVGSIYATATKADAGAAVTPALIEDVRKITTLPIVGIGGIKHGNAAPVIVAGGNAVAVVSAICNADNPMEATQRLKQEVTQAKQPTR